MHLHAMSPSHLPGVTRLCAQLGYPTTLEQVERRFQSVLGQAGHRQVVALDGAQVVGWMQLWIEACNLVEDPQAEIAALVVDEGARGLGVGKALVEEAKQWARAQGVRQLRVRSNVVRPDTHRFYAREGFHIHKTSHFFEQDLG
jgi:GNAT superfamily N-acetyltransferase